MEKTTELLKLLEIMAPGTELRQGIDNILSARFGALIVVSDDPDLSKLFDGGFFINCEFTPQRLFELSKMDGAIIIDKNIEKILYANVQLHPSSSIPTTESGTRHRNAERFAIQTDSFVISISERRTVITIYKGDIKYKLLDVNNLIIATNQAVRMVERYRLVIEKMLDDLTILEFDNLVTLTEVNECLQKFIFLFKVAKEAKNYIVELGVEGRLLQMQLDEIMLDLDKELEFLILDYFNPRKKLDMEKILSELEITEMSEALEVKYLSGFLGYERSHANLDKEVEPKGFRILNKITKLSQKDIDNIIYHFESFSAIVNSDLTDLSEIRGISKIKAQTLKNGLQRLRNTLLLEREIKPVEEDEIYEL